MLTKNEKRERINLVQRHKNDCGSAEIQISILTEKIKVLNNHMKSNHKDIHSRRGLIKAVEQRKKSVSYLKSKDPNLFSKIAEKLNIKK